MSFSSTLDEINSFVESSECTASIDCKDDALALLGTLTCVLYMDTFDHQAYAYYRGLIDKWISSYSGRTFIYNKKNAQVIQNARLSKNEALARLIFGLIPAFKKVIFDMFGFVPIETHREQTFSTLPVSRHHGQNKSRPMSFQSFMGTTLTKTPTVGGVSYSLTAKA